MSSFVCIAAHLRMTYACAQFGSVSSSWLAGCNSLHWCHLSSQSCLCLLLDRGSCLLWPSLDFVSLANQGHHRIVTIHFPCRAEACQCDLMRCHLLLTCRIFTPGTSLGWNRSSLCSVLLAVYGKGLAIAELRLPFGHRVVHTSHRMPRTSPSWTGRGRPFRKESERSW